MSIEIEAEEAAEILLRRRLARSSMVEFARYLSPAEPPALHHQLICDALDAVVDGRLRRLMIFCPPGSAKSTFASVYFPAFFLGKHPKKSIICASYGEGLSTSFGRKVRNIVDGRDYGYLFNTKLSEDSRAKGEWETNEGGSFFSAGVGTGITGRRADCLTGGTEVITRQGVKRIDELNVSAESCYILSYDREPVFARVLATLSRESEEYFRIHTQSGRVVEATGRHRIYTEGGYVEARDIAEGDVLLSLVSEGVCTDGIRVQEEAQAKFPRFLHNLMCRFPHERIKRSSSEKVQDLRGANNKEKDGSVLQRFMPFHSLGEAWGKKGNAEGYFLRILRDFVQAAQQFYAVLRYGVQEWRTCAAYDGGEQSVMARWDEPATGAVSFCKNIPNNSSEDRRTGFWMLRDLFQQRETSRPPHKYEPIRQSVDESGDVVRALPSEMARRRAFKAEEDAVVMVERVCEPAKVYDIQVEGTECFFANGVLVHNCGIIDDPVKGRKEADSELNRNETWEWYRSDFISRLKPNACQAVIQTRWHENDLSGRILPDGWNGESGEFMGFDGQVWTVICIPAQARAYDILGRKPGEWLWTEWFNEAFWEETKKIQTATDYRNWNSLYQQTPQPDAGTFFQREWFKRYKVGNEPEQLSVYGASDYAVSDGKGDFTEHGIAGFDNNEDLYFLDWWSGQKTPDVWIDEELRMAQRHNPYVWVAEGGPIRRSIEPFLLKRKREKSIYFRTEWIVSNRDKASNARGFQALASMGKVYIPFTEWGEELLNELVRFIPGTNYKDDKVDVCGLFGRIVDQVYGPSKMLETAEPILDMWGRPLQSDNNWKTS